MDKRCPGCFCIYNKEGLPIVDNEGDVIIDPDKELLYEDGEGCKVCEEMWDRLSAEDRDYDLGEMEEE